MFRQYSKLTISVFILLLILYAGYIFRRQVPYNFEFTFAFFLYILGYLLYRKGKRFGDMDGRWKRWVILTLIYCLINYAMSAYHAPLGAKGWSMVNITSLFIGFLVITWVVILLEPSKDFFWYLLLAISLIMLMRMVSEFYFLGYEGVVNGVRYGGVLSNPIKFGQYVGAVCLLMLGGLEWAYRKGKWLLALWCILLAANFIAVILSQTRVAWISLLIALIVWAIFYTSRLLDLSYSKSFKLGMIFFAVAIFVGVLIGVGSSQVVVNRAQSAITQANDYFGGKPSLNSIGHRLLSYELSVDLIKQKPITGYGADNLAAKLKTASAELVLNKYNKKIPGFRYSHMHNQFLTTWINFGILAVLSLVSMLAYLLYYFVSGMMRSSKENRPLWIAGILITLDTLIAFIPGSPLQYEEFTAHFLFFISLLFAVTLLLPVRTPENRNNS